ncbi:MAG TPA: RIP metalloprotease RseP [Spirochaetota bacterium]|nr:RIP metalloprotease RseP [Spirochaetota bacterium]
MTTLTYIFGAVVLLGLCIFVHELGHLLGGKMVGIKARIFSMGYGKGVLKKKIGDTTYQVTLIPLGGYCQFYGEDPSENRSGEGFEFLSAHPLKRIVTVAMGPIFNLIFGIILFYMMNLVGYSKETNRVMIPPEMTSGQHLSAAYTAGLRTGDIITDINGKEIKAFTDIQTEVFFCDGEELQVTIDRDGRKKIFSVKPDSDAGEGRFTIGVMPYASGITVTRTVKNGPAQTAGLGKGDVITKVDDVDVHYPSNFSGYLQKNQDKNVSVSYVRKGETKTVSLKPVSSEIFTIAENNSRKAPHTFTGDEEFKKVIGEGGVRVDGKPIRTYNEFLADIEKTSGRRAVIDIKDERHEGEVGVTRRAMIGIEIGVAFDMVHVQYGVFESFKLALIEPWDFIVVNLKGFGMLFSGELNVRENLSGPIRIAKIAGDVLTQRGVADFILLMARISIILMFMNLLPIPAVDGSHIVFYTIEAIRGKPIKESIMIKIQTFGIIFLIVLGVFVIVNDISMLPAVQDLFK